MGGRLICPISITSLPPNFNVIFHDFVRFNVVCENKFILFIFIYLKSQHDIIQFKNEYRMIKSHTKLAMQGGSSTLTTADCMLNTIKRVRNTV